MGLNLGLYGPIYGSCARLLSFGKRLNPPAYAHPLILGINKHRKYDNAYQDFMSLVSGHVSNAVAKGRAHELEQQRLDALAQMDKAKTEFFSNVSHEFRTPISLILVYIIRVCLFT